MKHLKKIPIVLFILLCICTTLEVHAQSSAAIAQAQNKEVSKVEGKTKKTDIVYTNIVDKAFIAISECLEREAIRYSWANKTFLSIPVWRISGAGIFILLGGLLKWLLYFIMRIKLATLIAKASRGRISSDRIVFTAAQKPLGMLILATGIALAFAVLIDKAHDFWKYLRISYTVVLAALFIWFLFRCIDSISEILMQKAKRTKSRVDDQVVPILRKATKIVLTALIILWTFSSLGFDITALIAGLGIGGLAVALGLQDTLANLFGSIFIMLDHPFRVGDRIVVDTIDGIVEQLGLRSTRIRTLDKTLVCIPNKTVANSTINNITSMPMRKAVQTIGLTYETTAEQIEEIVDEIHQLIKNNEAIDQDFTLVNFVDFGESSLNILVIYFTKTADYAEFQKVKQQMNLSFMRVIRERGLSIAFPTRTLYIENTAKQLT